MSEQEKHIKFIKEVAKYFMDFLETDFHKKKAPKRSISYTNSQWYLVGVSLAKYEKITNVIRKTINEWFDKDSEIKVKKWNYTTSIPKNFLDVIKLNVNKFSQDIISEVVEQISKETRVILVNCQFWRIVHEMGKRYLWARFKNETNGI